METTIFILTFSSSELVSLLINQLPYDYKDVNWQ